METALAETLARLTRTRLAEECAKLDPLEEQQVADQPLGADAAWPEYVFNERSAVIAVALTSQYREWGVH